MYRYALETNGGLHIFELPWRIFNGEIFLPDKTIFIKLTREYNYQLKAFEAVGTIDASESRNR